MINYTKFFLLTILVTVCGVTIAETPIEDNEYVIFYHHDVLGSPVAVSDGKGRVLWYEDTDPYGEGLGRNSSDVITSVGNPIVESADNRMGYAGHEKDNNSGLTYMKARHYDPIIGRFYSNDPVGLQANNPPSFNRYSYANGSPYRYVDPDGENAVTAFGGFISETWEGLTGRGDGEANYSNLSGALKDGYNGEGAGIVESATQDALAFGGGALGAISKLGSFLKGLNTASKGQKSTLNNDGLRSLDKQWGGIGDKRKKPGSHGKFKGRDGLRAENKQAHDAARRAGLSKDKARQFHDEISGQGYSFKELVQIAKEYK